MPRSSLLAPSSVRLAGLPMVMPVVMRMVMPVVMPIAMLVGLGGCPDDEPPADAMPMASGFAQDESTRGEPGTVDGSAGRTTSTSDPDESGEPWAGTAFVGDIRGVLTVTFTSAHALLDHDVVGLAGGYRSAEVGWDGTEDLYSPIAYQLAFPAAPEQADTLLPAEPVPAFDWGNDEDWLVAGNGLKLRQGAGGPELLACLLAAGTTGQYSVYRSSAAMGVPAECNPPATAWSSATLYDVVAYGGELFEDNVLPERVTTPPALVVTAPDLDAFDAPLASDQDLTVAWDAGSDPEARIIIRVIDADTNVITVHAADDGEYTIPAAELGALTLGPLDLLVTRERTDRVQLTAGGLTVLSRHERWGFFDLF